MRETFTSGSVGRAPGNRCLYPEPDCLQRPMVGVMLLLKCTKTARILLVNPQDSFR